MAVGREQVGEDRPGKKGEGEESKTVRRKLYLEVVTRSVKTKWKTYIVGGLKTKQIVKFEKKKKKIVANLHISKNGFLRTFFFFFYIPAL